MHWYLDVLRKFSDFSGRARRQEYWMFFLMNLIVAVVVAVVAGMINMNWLYYLYVLITLIPAIAVGVRRLHDTGRSGWWMLLIFIPLLGALVLLYFYCVDSEPGDNAYGPNPKTA